ncbi:MAG: hypothetical protein CVU81_02360 [Euryarchaeota archaeon HGW-Euryarchaeota-1]|nr:MAG: hypothetical protein CVU81_02360 [Euryarchaeota archaeon HGW-Euryarchaeota-1]
MVGENNNNMVGENNNTKEVKENVETYIRISCPHCGAGIDLNRPSLKIPGPFRCPNLECAKYFIVTGNNETYKFPYVSSPWREPIWSLNYNV